MPVFFRASETPHKMSNLFHSAGGNNLAARAYGMPGRQGQSARTLTSEPMGTQGPGQGPAARGGTQTMDTD